MELVMAFKPFRTIRVDANAQPTSKNINDLQLNIEQSISQVLGNDQLDSVIIKNIQLEPGLNKVSHTLSRNIQGWKVIRPRQGYALLWEDAVGNPSPNLLIYMYSAAACLIDLEVF